MEDNKEIPWKSIIEVVLWLINVFGLSKSAAISCAATRFSISESAIRKHL